MKFPYVAVVGLLVILTACSADETQAIKTSHTSVKAQTLTLSATDVPA